MKAKQICRPDEEPDWDLDHWTDHEFFEGVCEFCGQEGHRRAKCPNRPDCEVWT